MDKQNEQLDAEDAKYVLAQLEAMYDKYYQLLLEQNELTNNLMMQMQRVKQIMQQIEHIYTDKG